MSWESCTCNSVLIKKGSLSDNFDALVPLSHILQINNKGKDVIKSPKGAKFSDLLMWPTTYYGASTSYPASFITTFLNLIKGAK